MSNPLYQVNNNPGTNTIYAADLNQYYSALTAAAFNNGGAALLGTVATDESPQGLALWGGQYLLVACAGGGAGGLDVFDLSTPDSPSKVSYTAEAASGGTAAVATLGRYAVTGTILGSTTLYTWDLSNPSAPANDVGSYAGDARCNDLVALGRYVVYPHATDSGLEILDYANPAAPRQHASVSLAGPVSGLCAVGDRYVAAATGTDNQIQIVAVPDGTIVGTLALGAYSLAGLCAYGDRYLAVCAQATTELLIVDVSNPSAPVLAGNTPTGTTPEMVVACGRFLLTTSNDGSVRVSDGGSPQSAWAPRNAGTISGLNAPRGLLVYGHHLYVAESGANTLAVIDLSGLELSAASVGGLRAGVLRVSQELSVGGRAQARRLDVGPGGAFIDGDVAITGAIGGHLRSAGPTPSVTVQAAAGTGATASIASGSTDCRGQVQITPSGTPAAGRQVLVTFATPFASAPFVTIAAYYVAGSTTDIASRGIYVDTVTSTGFYISFLNAGTAGDNYEVVYQAIG